MKLVWDEHDFAYKIKDCNELDYNIQLVEVEPHKWTVKANGSFMEIIYHLTELGAEIAFAKYDYTLSYPPYIEEHIEFYPILPFGHAKSLLPIGYDNPIRIPYHKLQDRCRALYALDPYKLYGGMENVLKSMLELRGVSEKIVSSKKAPDKLVTVDNGKFILTGVSHYNSFCIIDRMNLIDFIKCDCKDRDMLKDRYEKSLKQLLNKRYQKIAERFHFFDRPLSEQEQLELSIILLKQLSK